MHRGVVFRVEKIVRRRCSKNRKFVGRSGVEYGGAGFERRLAESAEIERVRRRSSVERKYNEAFRVRVSYFSIAGRPPRRIRLFLP